MTNIIVDSIQDEFTSWDSAILPQFKELDVLGLAKKIARARKPGVDQKAHGILSQTTIIEIVKAEALSDAIIATFNYIPGDTQKELATRIYDETSKSYQLPPKDGWADQLATHFFEHHNIM